jgi:hypothetical protein
MELSYLNPGCENPGANKTKRIMNHHFSLNLMSKKSFQNWTMLFLLVYYLHINSNFIFTHLHIARQTVVMETLKQQNANKLFGQI